MNQGEIWRMEQPHEKSRPVIVVTRSSAIPTLNKIVVAPVTSTLRSIPRGSRQLRLNAIVPAVQHPQSL